MKLEEAETKVLHVIRRSLVIAFYLLIITFLIKIAPNYVKEFDLLFTPFILKKRAAETALFFKGCN